jgi:hypothetical protein
MLRELQAFRKQYATTNQRMYWALTIAIDHVIGLSSKGIAEDMERLKNAFEGSDYVPKEESNV